jgi:hypothetical protein
LQIKWQVKDLIDLEYFLNQTSAELPKTGSPDTLSPDRRCYLSYEKSHKPPFPRRDLIKYWLDEKRKANQKVFGETGRLPGDGYRETVGLLRSLVIITSLFSGAAIAWSVLSYGGTAPINIFTCLWVLIVPQFILLIFLGLSLILSRLGLSESFRGIYPLISSLLLRLTRHAKLAGETSLPADQRNRIYAMAGFIGRQKTLYGSVFFWPVFILAQVFGVCFNIGLLGATVLKLTITDLAFGWQSTLHPRPETVYRIVDAFSLPWSWVSFPHPTISQIQGSQMILKDGMIHLATPDLISWWPFLCYSILCYGLIPRLILMTTGIWQQNRALGRVSFSTNACDRLIQRMRTPQVRSSGQSYASVHADVKSPLQPDKTVIPAVTRPDFALEPAIVFVPEDIDGPCSDEDLNERIAYILGLKVISRKRVNMEPSQDLAAFEAALSRTGVSLSETRIVVLMEAWLPPIRETISWLNSLRNTVGKNTGLIVALIGKPADRMIFTSPDNADRVIWEQAVNRLGDPFMRVENLGGG